MFIMRARGVKAGKGGVEDGVQEVLDEEEENRVKIFGEYELECCSPSIRH